MRIGYVCIRRQRYDISLKPPNISPSFSPSYPKKARAEALAYLLIPYYIYRLLRRSFPCRGLECRRRGADGDGARLLCGAEDEEQLTLVEVVRVDGHQLVGVVVAVVDGLTELERLTALVLVVVVIAHGIVLHQVQHTLTARQPSRHLRMQQS